MKVRGSSSNLHPRDGLAGGLSAALALNEYKLPNRRVFFHRIHPRQSPRIGKGSARPVAGFYAATPAGNDSAVDRSIFLSQRRRLAVAVSP